MWVAGSEKSRGVADHHVARGYVLGNDGAGANQGLSPDGDAAHDDRAAADACPPTNSRRHHFPVLFDLRPSAGRGPRIGIVDEHDSVTHEDFILDRHALADKSVAGDFAAGADDRVFLNLDKRPDPTLVADRAAVEINEAVDRDVFSQPHVGCDPETVGRIHFLLRARWHLR